MKALPQHGTYRSFTAEELDRLDVSTDMMRGFVFDVLRCALDQPEAKFYRVIPCPTYIPVEA
jgi:hypothetical protein